MSKEYITSTYGIRIYICCASCHKNVHGKGCKFKVEGVKGCSNWEPRYINKKQTILNAGKGGGNVKTIEYFRWKMFLCPLPPMLLGETLTSYNERLHKLYEKETGTPVYYNM